MSGRFGIVVLGVLFLLASGCGGSRSKNELTLDAQAKEAKAIAEPGPRAQRLAHVGEKQIKSGEVSAGEQTLAAATEAAGQIEDASTKAGLLITIGETLARAGKPNPAEKALIDAETALSSVTEEESKALGYAELGVATEISLKNPAAAAKHLKIAEEAAEKIEDPLKKTAAFAKILMAYERAKRTDSQALLEKIKVFITALSTPANKVVCFAELGDALAQAGKKEEATAIFKEADKVAEDIKEDEIRASAYLTLGIKLKQAGRSSEGRKALTKAEDAADKIKDAKDKGPLLTQIKAAMK